jgi:hypothetical protein
MTRANGIPGWEQCWRQVALDRRSHSALRRVCVANPISAERERRSESDQSDFRAVATRVAIRSATLATASLKPWSPPILVKTAIAISREG